MRLASLALIVAAGAGSASSVASSPRPYWVRTFSAPESLPRPFPACCGRYWDTLLVSGTSSAEILRSPTARRDLVLRTTTGPNNGQDYADWSFVTQDEKVTHGENGSEIWLRESLYFPRSFLPTGFSAGQQNSVFNWLIELHDVDDWSSACPTEDPATFALGILNADPKGSFGAPGLRFRLRLAGGRQTNSNCAAQVKWIDGPRLRRRHWYHFIQHVVFSPDEKVGLVELWIDRRRVTSLHFPTLYTHPNGVVSRAYLSLGYYRMKSNWRASLYFDNIVEGPTRSSLAPRWWRR